MGCRIAKRKEWMVRIMHELDSHNQEGIFLTLTYDQEHLPENNSLVKDEISKFMKRLRKHFSCTKLRFYACGEYGEENQRPHYHAIIFGLNIWDTDPYRHHGSVMSSKQIDRLWKFGINSVGTVTTASAGYVAGYIEKKLTGALAEEQYTNTGRIAPYSRQSQGIGRDYADANQTQIRENLNITINSQPVGIPQYYKRRLKINANDLYESSQKQRQEQSEKLRHIYESIYKTSGESGTDDHRRKVAQYRYEALKAKYQLKHKQKDEEIG